MNCKEATESYESWLAKHTRTVEADLELKHHRMSEDVFSFMRATFYRWLELWKESCADLAKAPEVLAVGDLHVENFGTWRDREGRLVWGINDFDEASALPYINDLLRLAVSAHLAILADDLSIRPGDACRAILGGYAKGLDDNGHPFVLAERNDWLRSTVMSELRDPEKFWDKLSGLPAIETKIPGKAKKVLIAALPDESMTYRIVHRVAGLGSLGRQRFLAMGEWNGGLIAHEAKALAPSASVWASGQEDGRTQYDLILEQAIRCPDPSLRVRKKWVVRRLAPDCSRVELKMLPRDKDQYKLLEAMGRETANVHIGSNQAIKKVRRDLLKRKGNWLHKATKVMVEATTRDWQEWCAMNT